MGSPVTTCLESAAAATATSHSARSARMPLVLYASAVSTRALGPLSPPAPLLGGTAFLRDGFMRAALRPLGPLSVKLSAFKSLRHLISYGEKISIMKLDILCHNDL